VNAGQVQRRALILKCEVNMSDKMYKFKVKFVNGDERAPFMLEKWEVYSIVGYYLKNIDNVKSITVDVEDEIEEKEK